MEMLQWPQKTMAVTVHSLPGQPGYERLTHPHRILPTSSGAAQMPLPSHPFEINRQPLLCCPVTETQLQHRGFHVCVAWGPRTLCLASVCSH